MSEATNNAYSRDGAGEAAFRRGLVNALREAETSTPSPKELCHEAYKQLCLDEPLVSSRGCRALAKALLDTTSTSQSSVTSSSSSSSLPRYALSDPLVDGIHQICQRISREDGRVLGETADSSAMRGEEDEDNDKDAPTEALPPPQESLLQPEPEGESSPDHISSACATLAWTVHGRIPLLVCMSSGRLEEASKFLGSFRGPALPPPPEEDEEASPKQDEEPQATVHQDETPTNDDHDSLAEVWAAESDPSDYGYDSGFDPSAQLQELNTWATSVQVEPLQLSQPLAETTWADVAQAVTNLLRNLSFTTSLSGLSLQDWRQLQLSQHLTQLTLTLLLPRHAGNDALFSCHPNHHWHQLALQPLHVFRDAVTVHPDALMSEYVQLLTSLIQVNHQLSSQQGSTKNIQIGKNPTPSSVPPATWIGLSLFSGLCSTWMDTKHVPQLRTSVLAVADDLTALLEDCADTALSEEQDSTEASTAVIPWTFLPLLQIVTSQGRPSNSSSSRSMTFSSPQAQILLNSGLFRQWLGWWEKLPTTRSNMALCLAMQHNMFALCCAAPTLLGKYAWRYPGFAARTTDVPIFGSADPAGKTGDGGGGNSPTKYGDPQSIWIVLLWNLLGYILAEQSGPSTARIQWKKGSGQQQQQQRPSPTVAECQQRAWERYAWLCQTVADCISQWKSARENPSDCVSTDEAAAKQSLERELRLLEQFDQFCRDLTESSMVTPRLLTIFCFHMVPLEGNAADDQEKRRLAVQQSTVAIQKVLATWVPTSHEVLAKLKQEDEAQGDDSDQARRNNDQTMAGDRMNRQRPRLEDDAVARIRKSVKMLQSAIDSCATASSSSSSIANSHNRVTNFSSKAD